MKLGNAPLKKTKVNHYIREWRKSRGLSQQALAEFVGVTDGAISQVERGDTKYTQSLLEAIAKSLLCTPGQLIDSNPSNTEKTIIVPLISWVSAGSLLAADGVMPYDDVPMIETAALPHGDWIALRVEGDSMDRISPPGAIIFVNKRDKSLVANACYVIADEDGAATYKRYRPSPDRFEPVSLNPSHEAIYPQGATRIIGRVRRSVIEM